MIYTTFCQVIRIGTIREFGLGYYTSPDSGHMVVLKAWKNWTGKPSSRLIDFQLPPDHPRRFVENLLPKSYYLLIHFDPTESINSIIRENRNKYGGYDDPKGTWFDFKDLIERADVQPLDLNNNLCYGFDESDDKNCLSGRASGFCDRAICTCILNNQVQISDKFCGFISSQIYFGNELADKSIYCHPANKFNGKYNICDSDAVKSHRFSNHCRSSLALYHCHTFIESTFLNLFEFPDLNDHDRVNWFIFGLDLNLAIVLTIL